VLHRWHLRVGQKGGYAVGKTKRGKGTKLMLIADRSGLPVAAYIDEASPHEVTLVGKTLASRFVTALPQRLIGDRAYDSDPLDAEMAALGVEMISPHRKSRVAPPTQDGRPLRRYRRRWKVERLNAWLQNFRRVTVRWDLYSTSYLGMVHLACMMILLRHL